MQICHKMYGKIIKTSLPNEALRPVIPKHF